MGHEFIAEAAANQGDWELSFASAEADREFGRRSGSLDRVAWGGMSRGWALWGMGRLRESADSLLADLEIARRIGEGRLAVWLSCIRAVALADLGEAEEARALAEWSVARAATFDQMVMRSAAARALIQLHIHAGDWQAVLDAALSDLELCESTDNRIPHFLVGAECAEAFQRLGRHEEAHRWTDRGLQVNGQSGSQPTVARLLTTRGKLHEAQGRRQEADRDLAEAITIHENQGLGSISLAHSASAAACGAHRGDLARAREDLSRALDLFAACEAAPERNATQRELDAAR